MTFFFNCGETHITEVPVSKGTVQLRIVHPHMVNHGLCPFPHTAARPCHSSPAFGPDSRLAPPWNVSVSVDLGVWHGTCDVLSTEIVRKHTYPKATCLSSVCTRGQFLHKLRLSQSCACDEFPHGGSPRCFPSSGAAEGHKE